MTIRPIVKCARLGITVLEGFEYSATMGPIPLQVLVIVLYAVVDMYVMGINE